MNFGYRKLYVNGQLKDALECKKYDIVCPGDENVIAQIAWASKQDAKDCLESAKRGFEYWSNLSLADRSSCRGRRSLCTTLVKLGRGSE